MKINLSRYEFTIRFVVNNAIISITYLFNSKITYPKKYEKK